jgi:GDP-mannose 6-dehydrogenase
LRALLDMARVNVVDVPLLSGTLRTNELVITDVVDRLIASPFRTIAMLGLSFKMDTDDLRESPNVELAERLIGKGFEVRIYDPIVNPERLLGSNLRYVESRLPHLRRLLVATPGEALKDADAALVSTSDSAVMEEVRTLPPKMILDLHGRLGAEIERLPGYEGVGWAV